MNNPNKENIGLVLSGGGINGFSYLGVLSYLNDIQCLQDINTYVGTSAGGCICMLLALDIELQSIVDVCTNIKFLQCFSNITMDIDQMFNSYGIIDTLELKLIIENLITETDGPNRASLTMKQAYLETGKHCTLVSTDVHTMNAMYINHESHPNMKCVDAILATCAIPFLFPAVHTDNHLAIDGFFMDNFAYEFALTHYNLSPYKTIAVCIHVEESNNKEIDDTSLFSYINGILHLVSTCIEYHQFNKYNCKNDTNVCILHLNTTLSVSTIVELSKHEQIVFDIVQEGQDAFAKYVRDLPDSIVTEYYLMNRYESE